MNSLCSLWLYVYLYESFWAHVWTDGSASNKLCHPFHMWDFGVSSSAYGSVSGMHMAAFASSYSWTRNRWVKGEVAVPHGACAHYSSLSARRSTTLFQMHSQASLGDISSRWCQGSRASQALKARSWAPSSTASNPPFILTRLFPREKRKNIEGCWNHGKNPPQVCIVGASPCSFRWNLCPVLLPAISHHAQLCSYVKLLRCLIFIILHINYVDERLTSIIVKVSQEKRPFKQSGCY